MKNLSIWSPDNKFIYILASENPQITKQLAVFIKKDFELRFLSDKLQQADTDRA